MTVNPQLAIRIAANVDELKRNLATGKAAIEALGPSVEKMAANWTKHSATLIQDARNITAAVQQVGAATLTAGDSAKALKTLDAAMAQLRATGQPVPALMASTADNLRRVEEGADRASQAAGIFKGALGALGVSLSVGAVVRFGGELLRTGDEIVRLSDRTKMSTTAVQEFQYISSQTSAPVEGLFNAVNILQQKIGDNDKGLVGGLKGLHLRLADIQTLAPEDQMYTIAEAIAKIQDPTSQARIAADLFGKSWKEIMPAIKGGMRELADDAPKMSDAQVRALDAVGDAWERLKLRMKVSVAEMLTGVTDRKGWATGLSALPDYLLAEAARLTGNVKAQEQYLAKAAGHVQVTFDAVPAGPSPVSAGSGLTDDRKKAIEDHAKLIKQLRDEYTGLTATTAAYNSVEALKGQDITKLTIAIQQKLNATMQAAIDVYRAAGKQIPDDIGRIYAATLRLQEVSSRVLGPGEIPAGFSPLGLGAAPESLTNLRGGKQRYANITPLSQMLLTAPGITPEFGEIKKSVGALAQSLRGVAEAIPQVMVQAFTGGGGAKGGAMAMGSMLGGALGSGLFSKIGSLGFMGGPIGAAVGSLAGPIIGAIANLFGPSKEYTAYREGLAGTTQQYQSIRSGAISQYGSIEEIRALTSKYGLSPDLADQLTRSQGMSQFDTTNINDINRALKEFKSALDKATTAEEEATAAKELEAHRQSWQGMTEIAAKYGIDPENSYMGSAFFQARSKETAFGMMKDWESMKAGGAQFGIMRDPLSQIAADALKNGVKLPKEMEWYFSEIVKWGGALKDTEGNALDLSKLQFADLKDETQKQTEIVANGLEKVANEVAALPPRIASVFAGKGDLEVAGDRYHAGGLVMARAFASMPRLHSGGEMPAWLLPGEGVLSRDVGMRAIGGPASLDAYNRGERPGGGGTRQPIVIQLVDRRGRETTVGTIDDIYAELERRGVR